MCLQGVRFSLITRENHQRQFTFGECLSLLSWKDKKRDLIEQSVECWLCRLSLHNWSDTGQQRPSHSDNYQLTSDKQNLQTLLFTNPAHLRWNKPLLFLFLFLWLCQVSAQRAHRAIQPSLLGWLEARSLKARRAGLGRSGWVTAQKWRSPS